MTNITIYHNKGVHWRDKVGPDTERVPAREILGVATRLCDFSVHIRFMSGIIHVEKWASRELMDRRERELLTHADSKTAGRATIFTGHVMINKETNETK